MRITLSTEVVTMTEGVKNKVHSESAGYDLVQ